MGKTNENNNDQRFWQMAIETWKASGLSVRQFCANEKLAEASFYSWRKNWTVAAIMETSMPPPKVL